MQAIRVTRLACLRYLPNPVTFLGLPVSRHKLIIERLAKRRKHRN